MKNLYIIIAVFIFSIVVIGCGNSGNNEGKNINLDSLVKIYPDSIPLLVKLGQKLYDKKDFSKAINFSAKAYRLDSNRFETRKLYADILNNKPNRTFSDIMEAQRHYKKLLKKEPKNTDVMIQIATTYSMVQDYEKAFQYINNALKINPRERDAYVLKGSIYLQLDNKKLAKSSYETAVQQDPKFYEGYLMLGTLYENEKDSICLEYYLTASKLKPKEPQVLYSLAYAYQNFNKLNKAKNVYKRMLQVDSTFSEALFQLGYIKQYKEFEVDSAKYYYQEAIKKNPKFVEAWHNLGMCFVQEDDVTNALQSFSKALKYNPGFELSRNEAKRLSKNFDPDKIK